MDPGRDAAYNSPFYEVTNLLTSGVAPKTWDENGGNLGKMYQIGDVLVVIQTPDNLAEVNKVFDCLRRAITANYFAKTDSITRAAVKTDMRIIYVDDSGVGGEIETEYINLSPLISIFSDGQSPRNPSPPSSENIVETICQILIDRVDADSWNANGGSTGSLRTVRSVLVVTQTPRNLAKVRTALMTLYESALRNDPLPQMRKIHVATQPAAIE